MIELRWVGIGAAAKLQYRTRAFNGTMLALEWSEWQDVPRVSA